MLENIEVLTHSSIRIRGTSVIYVDPFRIETETHDADIILITHSHFDHFSPEDIVKVIKPDTRMVVPEKMKEQAAGLLQAGGKLIAVKPGMIKELGNIMIETVPAYNERKPFHPKKNGWVGYIITASGTRIYVAGDTDLTKENRQVTCDIAMVPIGGTYTMDARTAAKLVNIIGPETAIPIHYGDVAGKREDEDVFRKNVREPVKVAIKMQRYGE